MDKKSRKIFIIINVIILISMISINVYGVIVDGIEFELAIILMGCLGLIIFELFLWFIGYLLKDYIQQILKARGKWKVILILILLAHIFRVLAQIRYSKK